MRSVLCGDETTLQGFKSHTYFSESDSFTVYVTGYTKPEHMAHRPEYSLAVIRSIRAGLIFQQGRAVWYCMVQRPVCRPFLSARGADSFLCMFQGDFQPPWCCLTVCTPAGQTQQHLLGRARLCPTCTGDLTRHCVFGAHVVLKL